MNLDTVAESVRADSTGFVDGMEMRLHQEVLVLPFGRRQMNTLGVPFSDTRTGCDWMGGRRSVRVATSFRRVYKPDQVFYGRLGTQVMSARL